MIMAVHILFRILSCIFKDIFWNRRSHSFSLDRLLIMSGVGASDAVSTMNGGGKNEGGDATPDATKDQLPVMKNENRIFGKLYFLLCRYLKG